MYNIIIKIALTHTEIKIAGKYAATRPCSRMSMLVYYNKEICICVVVYFSI